MRTRTSPATIRRGLNIAEQHNAYVAAREIGVHHKTIYRWAAMRDQRGPDWPTQADVDAWEADEAANGSKRRRRASNQAARRKYTYLTRQPVLTPSIGTMRRIQALYALGWTCVDMGNEIGASKETVARIMRGSFNTATPKTVKRIRFVYARLSMVVPTDAPNGRRGSSKIHQRARNDARRRGYAPPLAWDDDQIDNPAAVPDLGEKTFRPNGGAGRPTAELVEDVEWLLEQHPYATAAEIAARLGYADASGIQNGLKHDRGNRPDLLTQLARNAEVAA